MGCRGNHVIIDHCTKKEISSGGSELQERDLQVPRVQWSCNLCLFLLQVQCNMYIFCADHVFARLLVKLVWDAQGEKGGRHKNPWRPIRTKSTQDMPQSANERPFTEIHHNNKSLILYFLDDDQKAKECWQCQIEFPRRQKIILCDVGLSHEEKWAYPDPKQPGHKLPSTKYYCIKGSCIKIKTRYPCYDPSLLHIPPEANSCLQRSHFDLLSRELDFEAQHRSC